MPEELLTDRKQVVQRAMPYYFKIHRKGLEMNEREAFAGLVVFAIVISLLLNFFLPV